MDTRICKRCNKEFDINTLGDSYIKHRKFTYCYTCIKDVNTRTYAKNYILKKLPSDRSEEEKVFLKDWKKIEIEIPKSIKIFKIPGTNYNRHSKYGSAIVEGDEFTCVKCKKKKKTKEFYFIDKSKNHMMTTCSNCQRLSTRVSRSKKITREGYIYIIRNKAWKNYYKIGKAVDVNNRLNTYNTGSPLRDYEIIYYSKLFKKPHIWEYEIKDEFGEFIVDSDYEWYKFSDKKLKEVINYIETKDEENVYKEYILGVSNLDELD